jgi:hypothetical protein
VHVGYGNLGGQAGDRPRWREQKAGHRSHARRREGRVWRKHPWSSRSGRHGDRENTGQASRAFRPSRSGYGVRARRQLARYRGRRRQGATLGHERRAQHAGWSAGRHGGGCAGRQLGCRWRRPRGTHPGPRDRRTARGVPALLAAGHVDHAGRIPSRHGGCGGRQGLEHDSWRSQRGSVPAVGKLAGGFS